MTNQEIAEKILNTMERARFSEWYARGRFDDYIIVSHPKEDPRHVSREAILEDIVKLFGLDNS